MTIMATLAGYDTSTGVSTFSAPPPSPRIDNNSESEWRIVVALNFGITHTSVAYLAYREGTGIQEKVEDIRIIQEWPPAVGQSVPSAISYSPTTNGCRQWGYDIDDSSYIHDHLRAGLEDGSKYEELVKLRNLVKEATTNADLSVSVPSLLHKSPEVIATGYLKNIAEAVRNELRCNVGAHVVEQIPLDLVVSHPSLWSESVKRRYFHVVELAFNRSILPTLRQIYFVAEDEAVSQLCVMSHYDSLLGAGIRKGTSVIVCDRGPSRGSGCLVLCL